MCGRFVNHSSLSQIEKTFNVDNVKCEPEANYNVAPTHEILVVFKQPDVRLDRFHWGLVPHWAKDISIGSRMINARCETIAEKPSFRNAFKKRRCLILADGFYEWKGEKGQKQPMFITLPDGRPFAFAGLWETWNRKSGSDSTYKSCTIITTEASESFSEIHHRMPVILKSEIYESWLDPQNDNLNELKNILENETIKELVSRPVSKQVNSASHNNPSCIDPIS